MMNLV